MRLRRIVRAEDFASGVDAPAIACPCIGAVTLTKERKLYLGILGAGLAALVANQVFQSPGGQGPISDDYTIAQDDGAPADEIEIGELPSLDPSCDSIGQRLLATAQGAGLEPGLAADAFKAPTSWGMDPPPEVEAPTPDPKSDFERLYSLGSVMTGSGGSGFATLHSPKIKGGRATIAIGQSIDGYTLVAIQSKDGRWAEFTGPAGRIRLRMDEPEGREAQPTPAAQPAAASPDNGSGTDGG